MKKFVSSAVFALVLSLSISVSAQEGPRGRDKSPDGRVSASLAELKIVFDPNGKGPGAPAEAFHYLVDRQSLKEGVMYAFSTVEGREKFITARERAAGREEGPGASIEAVCADARFNKVAYGTGTDWLNMYCGQTNSYLNDDWNDRISYVEASGSWTILYKCYYFDTSGSCNTLVMQGGSTINDLNTYSFNNIISSIKVCPVGFTYSECQSF
jgi:hypothetical protein